MRPNKIKWSPSQEEIAAILEHVRYEIEHAFFPPKDVPDCWHIRESVYLAMLIHARSLLDFFEHTHRPQNRGRRDKDVLCDDFGFLSSEVQLSSDDKKRLDKDIAHLTYYRLRHQPATKPWPVDDILRPLRDRAAEFVAHVVKSPPLTSAPKEIEDWKALHQKLTSWLSYMPASSPQPNTGNVFKPQSTVNVSAIPPQPNTGNVSKLQATIIESLNQASHT
jgi:hypothetical protein